MLLALLSRRARARFFSTDAPVSTAKLVLRLRNRFEGVPLVRIKESLTATGNSYDQACKWIEEHLARDGAKKADKVQNRLAQQGIITILQRPGLGAVMLEMNCETDFVARNPLFQEFAIQTAASALLLHTPRCSKPCAPFISLSVPDLLRMPLLPSPLYHGSQTMDPRRTEDSRSVQQSLLDTIGRLGEKVELRRGVLGYEGEMGSQKMISVVHGAMPVARDGRGEENVAVLCGRIGALVALDSASSSPTTGRSATVDSDLAMAERQLAQHIIGMQPQNVSQLLQQPFLFDSQQTVAEYLAARQWQVRDFVRYTCGQQQSQYEGAKDDDLLAAREGFQERKVATA